MLRTDGKFKIFRIQHQYEKTGKWKYSNESLFANIPREMRVSNDNAAPCDDFLSSGKVWQETGVHGTYDKDRALTVLSLIAKHNTTHAFQVVEVAIEQKTEVLVQMDYEAEPM